MDAKQNISSIRHFLKKRHWVSDVFAGMCLIGAIACLAAQQEQHPFSLEDIWKWLADILNHLCRYQGQGEESHCHMS